MASGNSQTSQSSASQAMLVQVELSNDPRKGFDFEDEIVLHAMLKLREHQALAKEVTFAKGFDDIVLVNNFGQQHQQEYHLYQLKHKQDSTKSITWEDLLIGNSSVYSLEKYFASYLNIVQNSTNSYAGQLKSLVIVTNVGFGTSYHQYHQQNATGSAMNPTKLSLVIQRNIMKRSAQHSITQDDLSSYFQHTKHSINSISIGKRYKFSQQGIQNVTSSLLTRNRAVTLQNVTQFKEFLELLEFEVNTPSLNKIKDINKALIKTFFPFHWVDAESEDLSYQQLKDKVLELFKPTLQQGGKNMAQWTTVNERHTIFNKLVPLFKQDVLLGSVKGYETGILTNLYSQLKFSRSRLNQNTSTTWDCVFNGTLLQKSGVRTDIVNIFCNESNATVISLKLLREIQDLSVQHKTLVVQVNGEEGIKNIIAHFNALNKEVHPYTALIKERFCFVIEVSPCFTPVEEAHERISHLAECLTELTELRKWIQFIIVTQLPIKCNVNMKTIQDTPMEWKHLPNATRKCLFQKTIFLEGDIKKTSLAALRLKEETIGDWMGPVSLAELITHDESRPLCLGLPMYDADFEAMYVHRKIKLPLINTNKMSEELKQRLVYTEEDYYNKTQDNSRSTYHLLKPIDSSTGGYYLWSKPTDTGVGRDDYHELEEYVTRSKYSDYEIDESQLLGDNVSCFGTGSANNKLLIAVDLPGKGKTFLLTRLTNQFLKQQLAKENLKQLILRINLLEVGALTWEKSSGTIVNVESAIQFLLDNLPSIGNNKTPGANSLGQAIIRQICINSTNSTTALASVFLLLDGFDEINNDQRSIIFRLVDYLLLAGNGIKRIILTSRPDNGLEEKLEKHFEQFPLHLRNFTEEDQISFLVKRWNMKFCEERSNLNAEGSLIDKSEATDYIRKYAKELVKYSQKALRDEDRTFLDIPLQCMIVSECFFNDLKLYLRKCQGLVDSSDSNSLPEFQDGSFELLRLYNIFYETKISVLLNQKARLHMDDNDASLSIIEQLKRTFSDAVSRLSVFHMMKNMSDAQLMCRMSWPTYRNTKYGEDLEQARRLGLIQGLDDHASTIDKLDAPHVKFIHRTFAEYFFATFLLGNFLRSESCLLDNVALSGADSLADATCKLLTEKILIETEYAGVRRFFDRMLPNHIPPVGEKCPFAEKKRTSVMKEWPITSHVKFNTCVAQFLINACSPIFKTRRKISETSLWAVQRMLEKSEGALFNLLTDKHNTIQSPLPTLLMHCIKEYASRPGVSGNEREKLTHCVTLISYCWAYNDTDYEPSKKIGRRKTIQLLQWFDPPIGLSDKENFIFYNSLCEFVKVLATKKKLSVLAAFGLACARMKHHCSQHHSPNFKDHFKKFVKFIFNLSPRAHSNEFFKVDAATNDMENYAIEAQKSTHFRDVLSLSTLVFPDYSLLELQVKWFRAQLEKYSTRVTEEHANPFVIIKTMEFLLEQLDAQSPVNYTETKKKIVSCALDYVTKTLPHFVQDTSPIWHEIQERIREIVELAARGIGHQQSCSDTDLWSAYEANKNATPTLLWHLMLSDQQVVNDQLSREAFLDIFVTPIGRSALLAFADVNCCQNAWKEKRTFDHVTLDLDLRGRRDMNITGPKLLSYFPIKMRESKDIMNELTNWFTDKLKIVWQTKDEREFIDFLLKNDTALADIECPDQEKFNVCALPCLIFSQLVTNYIPDQLSRDGIEYLEEALKKIHLPEHRKSLWDGIMQQHLPCNYSTTCRHRNQEQMKTLKEKILKRKQELLSV